MTEQNEKRSVPPSEDKNDLQPNDELSSIPDGQDPTSIAPIDESDAKETVRVIRQGELQQVGPYKIIREIGEGGMGCVFEAHQLEPVKRKVAIKIIRAGRNSRTVIARFEAERQALAMMNHPNIARIIDAGETEYGQPYFAMELVDGVRLTKYCDDQLLTIDERLALFVKICDGIQHAHQKGILHRDLKPGNILVTEYDGKPVPKIIDFGLAKALETTERLTDKTVHTEFGQVLGTLKYMSPEQAGLDDLDIDTRSDIYSLGIILYELLTGSTPMDSSSIHQKAMLSVLEMVRDQDALRPSKRLSADRERISTITHRRRIDSKRLGSILASELDWIVMKSLEKDRNRRYASASAFADDVQRYLNDEPIEARPYSDTAYKLRKFVRKNRGLVASMTSIALILVAGIAGTTYGLFRATRAAENARMAKDEAIRMRQIADQKSNEADLRSQEAIRQTERADQERDVALQVTQFLQDSFLRKASAWERANARTDNSITLSAGNTTIKELLDIAAEKFAPQRIDAVFRNQPRVQAEILSTIAKAYEAVEELDNALKFSKAAADVVEKSFGTGSSEFVTLNINHFFTCLRASKRFAAMRPLMLVMNSCLNAIEAVESAVADQRPETEIASLRYEVGQLVDACIEKSFERLDPTKHALPVVYAANAPDEIPTNVLEAIYKFEDLQTKLEVLEGADSVRVKFLKLGKAFVDYAISAQLSNKGAMKESADRFAEVVLSSESLPEKFQLSMSTLELSLAFMYDNLGVKPDLALQMFEKSYLKISSVLDEKHPATAIFGIAYADALYVRNRHQESFDLFKKLALNYFLQLGASVELYARIIKTANATNRQAEASELLDSYLKLVSDAYGDHERTYQARYLHALYPQRFGDLNESVHRFQALENDLMTKLGSDDRLTLKYVVEFAELQHYSGNYEESIEKLESFNKHFVELGTQDRVAIKANLVLSRSYQLAGKFEASIQTYKKSIEALASKYGKTSDSANRERVQLLETYLQNQQNTEAIELSQKLIKNGKGSIFKASDPRISQYQEMLARGFYQAKDYAAAKRIQIELVASTRRQSRQSKNDSEMALAKRVFELSKTLRALREPGAAAERAMEALQIVAQQHANSVYEVAVITHLAGCLLDQESNAKKEEAVAHLDQAIEKFLFLTDETNPLDSKRAKQNLQNEINSLNEPIKTSLLNRLNG